MLNNISGPIKIRKKSRKKFNSNNDIALKSKQNFIDNDNQDQSLNTLQIKKRDNTPIVEAKEFTRVNPVAEEEAVRGLFKSFGEVLSKDFLRTQI